MGMPETEGDILGVIRDTYREDATVDRVAYVEEVGGFIGRPQPGSAMFKFGRNFGFILGVLQCSGFRIELVRPQKWQKHFGLGGKKDSSTTEWKNKLKSKAQQLFPSIKVTLKTSDALLILAYGQHCEGGKKQIENPAWKNANHEMLHPEPFTSININTPPHSFTVTENGAQVTCWYSKVPCETCYRPLTTDGTRLWCSRGTCPNESEQQKL